MQRVTVTELKNRLNEYLRLVKRGETLEVVERSLPVARVVGVTAANTDNDDLVERLVREGVITRPVRPPDLGMLDVPLIASRLDPVQILIEERGER